MRIALAIPPAMTGQPAAIDAEGITATALIAQAAGHEVTLLLPFDTPSLMLDVRHLLGNSAVLVRTFELPPASLDAKASDQARSLIWTRLLLDLDSELVLVFHDICRGQLRCTSPLRGKVVAHVTLPALLPSADTDFRGFKPDLTLPGEVSEKPALFGRAALARIVGQANARLAGSSTAPDSDRSYQALVLALRKLKRRPLELAAWSRAIAFNEGPMPRRQLLLDVSVIVHGDARSGIQRVVRSLVFELLQDPPPGLDVRPIHFLAGNYHYGNAFARTRQPTPFLQSEDKLVDFRQGDVYLALDLNSHLVEPAAQVFAQMQARGVSMNFVVYDILLVQQPQWWPEGTSSGFEKWLRSVATLADNLVCISAAVASDVKAWTEGQRLERYGLPHACSFHLGADVANSAPSVGLPANAAATLAAIRARPSFLMVGTIEPRKSHRQALDAFELLWSQGVDCSLVIVGRSGWLVDDLVARLRNHPERSYRLFWLEGASDEYLEAVYKVSTCLLAPSMGEGFGLPLVEAAQHGLPIIARDLPVFREVAGEHVHYFEGMAAGDLAAAVTGWPELRHGPGVPDSRSIRFLTWKESARQLLQAIAPALPGDPLRAPLRG